MIALVPQELDRHPLADRHQVEFSIAVKVQPRRVGDHATGIDQHWRDLLRDVGEVSAAVVAQYVAPRWIRIFARRQPTRDEKIRTTVAVEIANAHDPFARCHPRQRLRVAHEPAVPLIHVQPVLHQRRAVVIYVAPAGNVKIGLAITVCIEEHRPPVIVRLVGSPRLSLAGLDEATVAALNEKLAGDTGIPSDVDVIETIAIDIADGECWTMRGDHVREKWLHAEISLKNGGLLIRQPGQMRWFEPTVLIDCVSQMRWPQRRCGGLMLHIDDAIGLYVGKRLVRAVGPVHLESVNPSRLPEANVHAVIDRRHEAAIGRAVEILFHAAGCYDDLCAGARTALVWRFTLELDLEEVMRL